ncbi:unnamed protein product [Phaeothamnion confervicola]
MVGSGCRPAAAQGAGTSFGRQKDSPDKAKAGKATYGMKQRFSVKLENSIPWQVEEVLRWAVWRQRDLSVAAAKEEVLDRHVLREDVCQERAEAGEAVANLLPFGCWGLYPAYERVGRTLRYKRARWSAKRCFGL